MLCGKKLNIWLWNAEVETLNNVKAPQNWALTQYSSTCSELHPLTDKKTFKKAEKQDDF